MYFKRFRFVAKALLYAALMLLSHRAHCLNANLTGPFQFCPLPAQIHLSFSHFQYVAPCIAGDTIDLIVFWGDGTDTSFTIESMNSFCQFSGSVSHSYTIPGSFSPMLVANFQGNPLDTAYVTAFTVSPTCIWLEGTAFIDENENCSIDSTDDFRSNLPVIFKDTIGTPYVGFSDSLGNFRMSVPQGIGPLVNQPNLTTLERICPTIDDIWVNTDADSTFNLGYLCKVDSSNYSLRMHGPRIGSPGGLGGIDVGVFGSSCNYVPKQLTLTWEPLLTYEGCSGAVLPDSVQGNTAYWNFDFNNNYGNIGYLPLIKNISSGRLQFRTDTSAYMNQPTTMWLHVEYSDDETDSLDNSKTKIRYVGVAVDPNNKVVDPIGVGPGGRILPKTQLTYTINFQNTGNAPARQVKILDTLPEFLDPSTIQIMGSKHYMEASYFDGGVLRFDFPDINLPDSASNEPESHGWLVFKISPKDVPLGTIIENRVGIYFDYNAPVITNYTINTIDTFPYPLEAEISASNMTCATTGNGTASVEVTLGNGQYSYLWNTGATTKAIKDLTAGTYTVTVTDRADSILVLTTTIEHNPIHPNPSSAKFNVPAQVGAWQPYIHSVEHQANQLYDWTASGGEVLESAGNVVKVLWHAGPVGTLIVTQTNEFGCSNSDSATVPILFVGTEELGENPLVVFPNPTKDRLYIQGIPAGTSVEINVIDLQGRSVARTSTSSDSPWIEVGSLAPGNYQMQVQKDAEQVGSFPFVKE